MPRKNINLSDATAEQLRRLDNASAYIEKSIDHRWARAVMALDYLRSLGWRSNELLAACDILNGLWLHVHAPEWHGSSMTDGPEYADKWGVPRDRWQTLADNVSAGGATAFCLDLVVSEFWTGNSYLNRMIREK